MSDWTAGYVADIDYTYGYYAELNPLYRRLALLHSGFACSEIGTACELGFGQGMSINMHAAAAPALWWGTDFNPAQVGFARELAAVSGSGAQLFDQSFAEFCNRPDLPEFDYIGLHGVWSWISDENRAVIVDFIRRRLKVGGVLYISYNTQPGWAAFVPMRHLLTEHAAHDAPGLGIVSRIDNALNFAEKLLATNPVFLQANPNVPGRLAKLKEHQRNYLAHEYFNRDWHPMAFADMARWLEPAKLDYACSGYYPDHIDVLNLTADQQAFLKDVPDPMFRQTVRDFMTNQQFRREYWIKGARRLSNLEQGEALRKQRVLLIVHRPDVKLTAKGILGEASLQEAVYAPILDALADHKPRTLGWIEQAVKDRGIQFNQIMQAILMLIGMGVMQAAQEETVATAAKRKTGLLNTYLFGKARSTGELAFLASPVSGGGLNVPRFSQLFLQARAQGRKQPGEWAAFAWDILNGQGQRIILEGKTLETEEENLAELNSQARTLAEKQLPILQALGIA